MAAAEQYPKSAPRRLPVPSGSSVDVGEIQSAVRSLSGDVDSSLNRRRPVVKALAIGTGVEPPASRDEDPFETTGAFVGKGLLAPPYPPDMLLSVWENSSSLPQNIAAYVVNVDGLGHRLTPRIDFSAPEAWEKVQDALWLKRVRDAEAKQQPPEEGQGRSAIAELSPEEMRELLPSDEELADELENLRLRARLERLKLESFLEFVNPSGSFVELRREKRQDQEITGNAFWEVLRDKRGRVSRFVQVPPNNVRMTTQDKDPVKVNDKVQVGLEFEEVAQHRFFRRFAQQTSDTKLVWFKEFGDPRVVSRSTGEVYETMTAFNKATAGRRTGDQPATEMLHFRVSRPGEPHGVPRWIGAFLAVMGTRASEEVNYYFFDNKGVPPLAILVSGGRLDDDSVETIKSYVRDHLKGRENFHKILIIQADQDPLSGENPHLTFEKLADVQQGDSLFQNYEKANGIKVGALFRLPRIVRGESEDVNRATALVAFKIVDEQVFEPERRAFDSWFNRVILPELGITMWRFKSLGPQTRDPEKVAEIIVNLVKVGVLVPNEAREFASDILGLDLDHLEALWAKQPLQLTLAGFPADGSENDEDLAEMARLARDASNNAQRREALREAVEQADLAAVLHSEALLEGEIDDGDHQAASA